MGLILSYHTLLFPIFPPFPTYTQQPIYLYISISLYLYSLCLHISITTDVARADAFTYASSAGSHQVWRLEGGGYSARPVFGSGLVGVRYVRTDVLLHSITLLTYTHIHIFSYTHTHTYKYTYKYTHTYTRTYINRDSADYGYKGGSVYGAFSGQMTFLGMLKRLKRLISCCC